MLDLPKLKCVDLIQFVRLAHRQQYPNHHYQI